MKITNARISICSPGRNFVTLIVETDQGVVGLGDATLNGRELAVASYLEDHLLPCLIGRDPFNTEDTWQFFIAARIGGEAR
jgi:mannonate dehydratase